MILNPRRDVARTCPIEARARVRQSLEEGVVHFSRCGIMVPGPQVVQVRLLALGGGKGPRLSPCLSTMTLGNKLLCEWGENELHLSSEKQEVLGSAG